MTSGLTRFGGPRTVVCNLGTSGSLPAHQSGVAYSGTFSVTNRVGEVTAELVSATPALPAGWSLAVNQGTGVVTLAWPAAAPVSAPPLPNLDFEAGAANWLLGNAWIIDGAGLQDGGTQAGRYRGAGQSSLRHAQAVPVTPGTTITASARISKGTTRADFAGGAVVLEWLTAAGAPLDFSVGNVVNTGTAAFQTSTVTATAPAGAGLVRLAVSATRDIKGRASDSVYVDNVTWNHTYTLPGAPVTDYAVVIRVRDGRGCQATLSQTIGQSTGTWIVFARPHGSSAADQYSVASTVPSNFSGARRSAVVGGVGGSIQISGAGGGWLYAAHLLGGVVRSNDLGATWTNTNFSRSVAVQQRIDVRGGRVFVSQQTSSQHSDDNGTTIINALGRALSERYLFGTLDGVVGDRSISNLIQTRNNGTSFEWVDGFPTFGRNPVNMCAGTTHLVMAGAIGSPANRFSRVPIGTPLAAHTPFTVSAVSSASTWNNVFPSIAYGNGIFVMVTDQGQIVRSTDEGATWTVSAFVFPNPSSLVFGDGVFLICGLAGAIRTSADGDTWTLVPSGTFGTDDITNAIFVPN